MYLNIKGQSCLIAIKSKDLVIVLFPIALLTSYFLIALPAPMRKPEQDNQFP